MSFNWSEYLDLAKCLADNNLDAASEEARLRAAISRGYYAAFHRARQQLVTEHHKIPQVEAHKSVQARFENTHDPTRDEIAEDLYRLKVLRIRADYGPVFKKIPKEAELALKFAENIISNLDKL